MKIQVYLWPTTTIILNLLQNHQIFFRNAISTQKVIHHISLVTSRHETTTTKVSWFFALNTDKSIDTPFCTWKIKATFLNLDPKINYFQCPDSYITAMLGEQTLEKPCLVSWSVLEQHINDLPKPPFSPANCKCRSMLESYSIKAFLSGQFHQNIQLGPGATIFLA